MSIKKDAQLCSKLIEQSRSTVVLSGAGVSTASGIPDFRGPKGVYSGKDGLNMEKIFDIISFLNSPETFYKFHRDFIAIVDKAQPTYTHKFLAALESESSLKGIITQNIDALHQKAGSKSVYEIHGSVWTSHCLRCGKEYDYDDAKERMFSHKIPLCDCGGTIKPDIVFFGENVKHLDKCSQLSKDADLFFVLGSSLAVSPASYLPSMCKGTVVIVNKGNVHLDNIAEGTETISLSYDLDDFFRALNDEMKLSIQG